MAAFMLVRHRVVQLTHEMMGEARGGISARAVAHARKRMDEVMALSPHPRKIADLLTKSTFNS